MVQRKHSVQALAPAPGCEEFTRSPVDLLDRQRHAIPRAREDNVCDDTCLHTTGSGVGINTQRLGQSDRALTDLSGWSLVREDREGLLAVLAVHDHREVAQPRAATLYTARRKHDVRHAGRVHIPPWVAVIGYPRVLQRGLRDIVPRGRIVRTLDARRAVRVMRVECDQPALRGFALSSPRSVDVVRAFAQRSRIRTPTHSTSPTIAPATTPGIGCRRQTRPPVTPPKTSPGQPMNRSTSTSCGPVNSMLMSHTTAFVSGRLDHSAADTWRASRPRLLAR